MNPWGVSQWTIVEVSLLLVMMAAISLCLFGSWVSAIFLHLEWAILRRKLRRDRDRLLPPFALRAIEEARQRRSTRLWPCLRPPLTPSVGPLC